MRKPGYFLLSVILLLLTACQMGNAPGDKVVTPTSSPSDSRHYEYFVLPNQLRVLLVSDPGAEKAAVALNVLTGSKDDPEDREGLAHFLEHMLFLGTEKYPQPGEYQDFITANGGSHNAYTSFENTVYFFDIAGGALAPAMDRFSGFFTGPLFTAEYVEREKNAVESEYRAKLKDEGRRGLDVMKEIANPEHAFSKFTVGNLDTLADREGAPVRDDLLAFYAKHYSANQMTLVVLGPQNLEDLRTLVESNFSAVPNHDIKISEITEPMFPPGLIPAEVFITPEQNIRRLRLTFAIPEARKDWQVKPMHMLADVIGHEGEGSLLQYLRDKGLADDLSAGVAYEYVGGGLFHVAIGLTDHGYANRDAVVTAVFETIARLKEQGISRQRFEEQARIANLRFRYQEKSESINYVISLVNSMPLYPPKDILKGPYSFSKYDPKMYLQYLEYLNPDNVMVVVTGPGLDTDQVSTLYQTPYRVQHIGDDRLAQWRDAGTNPAIVMPQANPYIPTQFARRKAESSVTRPKQLVDSQNLGIWHGDDGSFKTPRASIRVALESPLANDSLDNMVRMQLLAALIKEGLNTRMYPAYLAGFDVELFASRQGLQLAVSGFSDKQDLILKALVAGIQSEDFSEVRFEAIKQDFIRRWENAARQPPYRYLSKSLHETLYSPYWTEAERLKVIETITLEDVRAYRERFLAGLNIRAMVYGNISANNARRMEGVLSDLLSPDSGDVSALPLEVITLKAGQRYQRELSLSHDDAAIIYYVQGSADDDSSRVLMGLTAQIIRSPYYNSLRTEQQFGYIVFATPTILERWPGLSFIVQSPVAGPGTLLGATELFIDEFSNAVAVMEEGEFLQHRDALESLINRPYESLARASGDYWAQLLQGYEQFDRRPRLTRALKQLELQQWQGFFQGYFIPQVNRGLVVWAAGKHDENAAAFDGFTPITDVSAFKADQASQVYP